MKERHGFGHAVSCSFSRQRGWSVFISGIKMRINNTADLPHGGVKINGSFFGIKIEKHQNRGDFVNEKEFTLYKEISEQ